MSEADFSHSVLPVYMRAWLVILYYNAFIIWAVIYENH